MLLDDENLRNNLGQKMLKIRIFLYHFSFSFTASVAVFAKLILDSLTTRINFVDITPFFRFYVNSGGFSFQVSSVLYIYFGLPSRIKHHVLRFTPATHLTLLNLFSIHGV